MPDCLIVDDEPDICELIALTVDKMGLSSQSAYSLFEAHQQLERHSFKLCLTDMKLPDGNGIDLVRFTGRQFPDMPIAMITAHGNMDSAIEAMKAGAFDFVQKPVDLNNLRKLIETALKLSAKTAKPTRLETDTLISPTSDNGPVLIGRSPVMQEVRDKIDRLARTQAPVHISGESGTGKEVAARMIHNRGPRADAAFIPVNCGAIPPELMESEFFGHMKGSFTGAVTDKKGLFQEADQGTLFLDEIADLPIPMQVKLLRAIQEKKIRPVGSSREIPVDVRIISATHKNLMQEVQDERFRHDLFYRVHVLELRMPPLRDHPQDIKELVDQITRRICIENLIAEPIITNTAYETLGAYKYPGNVRELENILESSLSLIVDGTLSKKQIIDKINPKYVSEPHRFDDTLDSQVTKFERSLIESALQETDNDKSAAAALLGLSMRQFRYKLEKLKLE